MTVSRKHERMREGGVAARGRLAGGRMVNGQ
jgi:hypothetical protein